MSRRLTDAHAKVLARHLVEDALKGADRDDAAIERIYLIPDRNLFVVVVTVNGEKFRLSFSPVELTDSLGAADQKTRAFVAGQLPKLKPRVPFSPPVPQQAPAQAADPRGKGDLPPVS